MKDLSQESDQRRKDRNLPLVSIITRTYKGRLGFLKEAVESVLCQTYPRLELVIVEDGSDTASEYIEKIRQETEHHIVYKAAPPCGRCYAGNRGLSLASGEFLGFLDDDDILLPHHVESLVDCLTAHPEAGGAYAVAWVVKTEVLSIHPLQYREHEKHVFNRIGFSRENLWKYNYIPIQAVLFRRMLYEKYGGFDESLDCLEDWDLWLRFTVEYDFIFLDKVTSMFRIPYDESVLENRRKQHLAYLPILRARQKALVEQYRGTPKYKELRKLLSVAQHKPLRYRLKSFFCTMFPYHQKVVRDRRIA